MKNSVSSHLPLSSLLRRTALLVVLFVAAGVIAWPQAANKVIDGINAVAHANIGHVTAPLVLGLDLQGGTRLEYSADLSNIAESEKTAAMEGVRDVIERRVNALGVSEPIVQVTKAGNDWRLSVELAGIRDVNVAIKTIGETPTLDFREENPEAGRSLTDAENKQLADRNAEVKQKAEAALAKIKKGASLEELARAESEDPSSKDKGGDLGWIANEPSAAGVYEGVRGTAAGKLVDHVIDDGAGLYVAEVLETKDAGLDLRASHILISWDGARESSSTSTKTAARARIEAIRKEVTPANFAELAKKYSEEPGASNTGGDLDWFGPGAMVKPFDEAVYALKKGEISNVVESEFGFHIIYRVDERPRLDYHIRAIAYKKIQPSDIIDTSPWKRTELTGKQLQRAQLNFDQQTGQAEVSLQFDDEGSKLFAELTKKNIGKPIGIFLDDEAISVPVVNQEIPGGQAVISGSFTINEAKLLAQRLQAGALPVPINIIAQQTVGPTLGGESVAASVRAGLIGFLLVAIFMILFYRIPGLLSIVALLLYAAILVALFKIIPVTLTLAGIAGFVLSLGIAVDANVLVFERLKEELREGKSIRTGLEDAFRRAWPSIRDGHVTVLITCAVLYGFSSSVIRGFALTLALGTILSLFTAVISCRTFLRVIAVTPLAKIGWLFLKPRNTERT